MDRLFHASVELNYEDKHGKQFIASRVVDRGEFWWNERKPDQPSLWDSEIRLGEDFFNEIISHPVPIDMNTLKGTERIRVILYAKRSCSEAGCLGERTTSPID